ncbi:MAG: ATP-dependent helicase HrpB [Verrucomicrobiales bacterium]|nr:ATP-dependent helicase HrpB [Verrucomicrobiales bacterium]|tara:strand:+ start:25738 stop:28299 length:2562 start_codon:yes stop_codon:yes gene_type:complete
MPRDRSLPIFDLETDLVTALARPHARIVIEAPTGSGKSTQVPQLLVDSEICEDGEIFVLQPRRIAARMLARRVAFERGSNLGDEIGFQVRFENAVSPNTRVRFVTEGILIRKFIQQPDLNGVAAVVLDEFHERHFFADITLARCLELQRTKRPDLKIIVMSATLNAGELVDYLGDGVRHLISEGRTFPVNLTYAPPRQRHKGELWDQAARAIKDHLKGHPISGHILVFMPGRFEIQKTVQALRRSSWASPFEILELYGELAPSKQDEAVSASPRQKIVVATNVAETSITIDGVTLVIDSGLERRSSFDHRRGITTLHIQKISQASADQRAGRAGRTSPGTAIRLWSERDHQSRPLTTPAEIHRMDLSEALLILSSSGIEDTRSFRWFATPDPSALDEAYRRLKALGTLDDKEHLTHLGQQVSQLPVPPRFGRVLAEASSKGCLHYVALITAITQARSLFPKRKRNPDHLMPEDFSQEGDFSDFQPLVRAWRQMQQNGYRKDLGERLGIHAGASRDVGRIAEQLVRIASRWKESTEHNEQEPDAEMFGRILLTGFSDRLALRHNANTLSCAVITGRRGQIENQSIAFDKETHLFIAGEMIEVEGRDLSVKLGLCTRIEEGWLREAFSSDFVDHAGAVWNERSRKVEARRERRFRDLVLESRPSEEVPQDEATKLISQRVLSGELNLKAWDPKVEGYFTRVNLVASHFPEYNIPPIDHEARLLMLEEICKGATSYKQIKDRPVNQVIKTWLSPHQDAAVQHLAPESLALSNGKQSRINYTRDEKPKISVLIQHIFGLKDSPTVCEGKQPVVIEILAPNHRPVQVTEDLASFWTGSYPSVRSQLRGRYPKHEWPEF